MGILSLFWKASREDAVRILRGDARPAQPGQAPKKHAEQRTIELTRMLDRRGPKQMSEEGFAKAQMLLKAAQARPAKPKKSRKSKLKGNR
jgi:hypothetical protein